MPKSLNESNQNMQVENHFISQMKDITAFNKNQLMEVAKSTAKNQITDIPKPQSSNNIEQPISNQIPLHAYIINTTISTTTQTAINNSQLCQVQIINHLTSSTTLTLSDNATLIRIL